MFVSSKVVSTLVAYASSLRESLHENPATPYYTNSVNHKARARYFGINIKLSINLVEPTWAAINAMAGDSHSVKSVSVSC